MADIKVKIPMDYKIKLLNVSVAAGISMYELKFKQVLVMLKEKIFLNLGRQIGVTGKLMRIAFDNQIKKNSDLNGMQVILMMIMKCDNVMTLEQISRDITLFGKELLDFLSDIESKGYVQQEDHNYSLTKSGEEYLAKLWPVVENTQKQVLSSLTDEEISLLQELLQKVQDGCISISE